MKDIWRKLKPILGLLLVLATLLFLSEWISLYNSKDFRPDLRPLERMQESFMATVLYSLWGIVSTITRQ